MKKFLVVDDSAIMRKMLGNILVKHGYSVIGEAENGIEAIEMYKIHQPDMVTLDITMKEMDGLTALKEIIKIDKDAKVVMVSAMGQQSFIMEALKGGAKGFLVKPFKEKVIISTMEKLFI